MDVTNPGLVNVADEVEGNPDPNGGTAQWTPREVGTLEPAADDGYPPAPLDPPPEVFPTPTDEVVSSPVPLLPVLSEVEPDAAEVSPANQSLGQGSMVPVDPLDPAAGTVFLPPAEFVVTGPTLSVETNRTVLTDVLFTVTAVLDADALPAPAGPDTLRYYLRVATPPALTSYPVSLLGRQVVFADDTLTALDQGAARVITGFGGDFVVVNRDDETEANGDVDSLAVPQAGDTFSVEVYREGGEDVSTTGNVPDDVFVLPPPPAFVADPAQALLDQGDVFVDQVPTGPIVPSGEQVPTASNSYPAEQTNLGPGLPANVFA